MISVIICNIVPAKWIAIQAMYRGLLGAVPHELIGIHDAPSMCAGYERGMRQSKGDILIFSHDDVEFLAPNFAERVQECLREFDVIGVAGTTRLSGTLWGTSGVPHIFGQVAHKDPQGTEYAVSVYGAHERIIRGIHALDGLFLACRRDVALKIGWDAATFDRWHFYDLDFTFRAHLAGHKLAVVNDLYAIHASLGTYDATWHEHAKRFLDKFCGRFDLAPVHKYQESAVLLSHKSEIIPVMTPDCWPQLERPGGVSNLNMSIGW